MRILIVYGTTEGHTRTIAHFAADSLRAAGFLAAVEEAGRDGREPKASTYDAIILAASVHVGRFQAALVNYARTQHEDLNAAPSAFISTSLCAAGVLPHDWEGVDACVARFQHETQWTPTAVHNAAGAIRFSQYDFFKRLALWRIVQDRGEQLSAAHDYDLTDYSALERFVLDFASAASQSRGSLVH